MGPLERKLNWVCAARNHRSLVSLSLACGLSRTTLFNAVNRERSGRLVQLESRTAEKIAHTQRIPLEWVLHGDPDAPPSTSYGGAGYSANAHGASAHGASAYGPGALASSASFAPSTSRVFARRPGLGEAVDMGLLRSVVDTLITHDGLSKEEAGSLVGNVLFTDEAWGSSSLDLYRAVRARLEARSRGGHGSVFAGDARSGSLAEGGRGG